MDEVMSFRKAFVQVISHADTKGVYNVLRDPKCNTQGIILISCYSI